MDFVPLASGIYLVALGVDDGTVWFGDAIGGVVQAGLNVLRCQLRVIPQQLRYRHLRGQGAQDLLDTDAQAANRGFAC